MARHYREAGYDEIYCPPYFQRGNESHPGLLAQCLRSAGWQFATGEVEPLTRLVAELGCVFSGFTDGEHLFGDRAGMLYVPPTPTPKPTRKPTKTPVPTIGLCVVDMSTPGAYFSQLWMENGHNGLDIAADYGTPHRSPGECLVYRLFIDDGGAHGIGLTCDDLLAPDISFGHFDFSYNAFETLRHYGVARSALYNEAGTPKAGPVQVKPKKNRRVSRGDDLHVYMSDSGGTSPVHTHINTHIWRDGEWVAVNPLDYLDCREQDQ